MVATKVAIMHGIKISVGLCVFKEALMAMILTGISVSPDACKQRNMICELEAVSFFGLISCKLSIAFIPKGVAALSSHSKLAEKFITICPIAGWFFGSSGNNLEKNGPTIRAKNLIPPAFSAMAMKPMNKAMLPIRFIEISTAVFTVAIMPSLFCSLKEIYFPAAVLVNLALPSL